MTDVDGYIRARESGRTLMVAVFLPFTLVAGIVVAISLGGVAGMVVAALVVALEIAVIAGWARTPVPIDPVDLTPPFQPGTWPASAPMFDFPDVSARNPRLKPNSELTGTFTLDSLSARWEPSRQSVRSFGATVVSWGPEWTIRAKGVRGFPGQIQLTLENAEAQPVVIWLRHATIFDSRLAKR